MIDYRSHIVSLALHSGDLTAVPLADPVLTARRDQQIRTISEEPGFAALGALVDHLFRHAASDGQELDLLARAATMWEEGQTIYTAIGQIRDDVEAAVVDPAAPGAAATFCAATKRLRALGEQVQHKDLDIAALGNEVRAMTHLPEHPRALDLKTTEWGWGDLFPARRTDAFVRSTFAHATTASEWSFAFGVLSSWSANACGSAYLNQVVGGPRRSHRFRDRLAANTMGTWFVASHPDLRQCTAIADRIRFDGGLAPEIPAAVETLLTTVVAEVYDPAFTPPPPDLRLGYRRLIRHLELLDRFELPPAPVALPTTIITEIYSDAANPPPPITNPETSTPPYAHAPGVHPTTYSGYPTSTGATTPTQTDGTVDAGEACGAFWLGVLAFLGFAGLLGGPCWDEWGSGKRCTYWDKYVSKNFATAFSPPALSPDERNALASQQQPLSTGQLTDVTVQRQLTELAAQLFEFQKNLWEALGKAKAFLIGGGLLYPDERLTFPLYRQFLTVPPQEVWPHRPEPDPAAHFYRYPPTPIEQPAVFQGLLPIGADLSHLTALLTPAATRPWIDIVSGAPGQSNPDLDADRGLSHKCWATTGSINNDPVDVYILGYQEM